MSASSVKNPSNEESNGKIALYSIIVYKWDRSHPIQIASAIDVSSFPFFHRSTIKQHIIFHSRLIASRTNVGNRQVVNFEQNLGKCHVYTHASNLCVTVLSTQAYPLRVAFGLIMEIITILLEKNNNINWQNLSNDAKDCELYPELNTLLQHYQDPSEADKLLRVQKGLDEVKDVMLQNIDDLLQRGEKLDDLMQKSEDLSNASYQFYRQAKKNNQCCQWY